MGNFFTPRCYVTILPMGQYSKLEANRPVIFEGIEYPTVLHAFTAFCLMPRVDTIGPVEYKHRIKYLPVGTLFAMHDMLPWGDEEFKLSSKLNREQAKEFMDISSLRIHTREAAFQGLQHLYIVVEPKKALQNIIYDCECYNEFFNESMARILNTKPSQP